MINKMKLRGYLSEPFDKEELMKFRERSKFDINKLESKVFKKELKIK